MDLNDMKNRMIESSTLVESTAKVSVGAAGSLTAMTINDWAGFIVALLTGVYMLFQIEAAWKRRNKENRNREKK